MSGDALTQGLVVAEERLRARGLTGSVAFDALACAWHSRLVGESISKELEAVIEAIPETSGVSALGLAYERFFPDVFKGLRGQFFTPPPVAELLVQRLNVRPGESVLDPTCGSGGLLTVAGRFGATLSGCELAPRLAELARLVLLHQKLPSQVTVGDAFKADLEPVDVVVANPPFSVRIEDRAVRDGMNWPPARRLTSDQAFAHHLARWVRPDGRAGVVLPYSVVANAVHRDTRAALLAAFDVTAICVLPEGVFRPFGGAQGRAALVWMTRRPSRATSTLWSRVTDPGYDVSSRRLQRTASTEIEERLAGIGWRELPRNQWLPPHSHASGKAVADVASAVQVRVHPSRDPEVTVRTLDLAEPNRRLGEVIRLPRVLGGSIKGVRLVFQPGTVLVSRLRPTQSNVTVTPLVDDDEMCVGSPEWLPLQASHPRLLFHILRTPTWREGLPVGSGQTRPRVSAATIMNSVIRWPEPTVATAVEQVSQQLTDARAHLATQLLTLQDAVDAYAAGELDDDELLAQVSALSR